MIISPKFAALAAFVTAAIAQQVGTQVAETHPPLTWQRCTRSGGCTTVNGSIVLDANWRWLHTTSGYTNCYTGNTWDTSICPNPTTCTTNCALDGANYSSTYGITTSGNALTLKFKQGDNIGSRVYLLASDTRYEMFKLKNAEFTFDVDVSKLGCGLNGAVYFVEMDADGGMARHPTNRAGAKYGTGYCDSQCPHDLKFINGEANILDWNGSATDPNAGNGRYGSCCNEMDIWEANSISTAYTPHGCSVSGPYRCSSATECGDGSNRYSSVCDKDGCDFNSYRMGDTSFYGPGKTVNTNSKISVVTQFLTDTGTATGKLTEIRRLYVQNGVVISNSKTNIAGLAPYDSITQQFCDDAKTAFGDYNKFTELGGYTPMDLGMDHGLVLVLSIWADHAAHMLWLDSTYPVDATGPGAARGTCPTTSGDPDDVAANQGDSTVTYSNIRFGEIDSTYTGTRPSSSSSRPATTSSRPPSTTSRPPSTTSRPPSTTSRPPSTTSRPPSTTSRPPSSSSRPTSSTRTSSAAGPGQTLWGQCGGQYHTGPTTCAQGTCTYSNPWYSQCLP